MALDVHSSKRMLAERPARQTPSRSRGEDVDWLGLGRTLWRHKFGLIAFVAAVTGLVWLYVQSLTPIYEAETLIMLNDRPARVVDIDEVLPGVPATEQGLDGQVMLIRSRGMADRLADRLNLHLLPEFNPALAAEEAGAWRWFAPFQLVPVDWLERLPWTLERAWAAGNGRVPTDLEHARHVREAIVETVRHRIVAEPANRASVIGLRFVSADPELAALGANTLADLYLEDQLAAKQSASERASSFLEVEIERLRSELATAESAIQDYRRETGLIEGGGPVLDNQQLSQITTQLVLARGERAAAEARLGQAQSLLNQGGIETAAHLLDYPAINELKLRELDLRRRMAELGIEYGERHPTMINLRAEQQELQERLEVEVRRVVQGLRNEVQVARSREGSLENHLASLQGTVADANRAEIDLRVLMRDADAKRALLDTYTARAAEIGSHRQMQEADARVISPAIEPHIPAYPRKTTILGLALFGSLLVGGLGVFGLERLDRSLRSGDQVESQLGLPTLGLIPAIGRGLRTSPETHALDRPNSSFGEALRSLRTALLLTGDETPPRSLLFTSALPEEGKSSMVLALARIHARSGRSTVIVDADLRRARLHKAIGTARGTGLSELLRGQAELDHVLHRDRVSGASFLSAGAPVSDPSDLLAGGAMRRLVGDLAKRFELVVIDSPPVLSVADARVLAQVADRTVFLVRWGSTRRQDAATGIKHLSEAGAHIAGVVLTRVDVRRHAKYGYSDSGYYYNDRYVKYYDA